MCAMYCSETYLQTLIFISLALSFLCLKSTSLWLVSVENQGSISLGTPAHEGVQQRQGGDSSNISPEAGCHGKLLTELSDTSSSW